MVYTINVVGSDISFECDSERSVLDSVLKAGYQIPYSCRKGVCGSCKAKVLSGNCDRGADSLTSDELRQGYSLLCQTYPRSNLAIELSSIEKVDHSAIKKLNARLYKLERVSEDVSILNLRFLAGVRVPFKSGQYLQVVLQDGERRSYSMANPSHQTDSIQLHVRHINGGLFTNYLLTKAAVGDSLTIELPYGDFYLRQSENPLIFLASGTGFAPIKSIFESIVRSGVFNRPVYFYWGGRKKADLYLSSLPNKWASLYPWFKFIPVLSEEDNGVDRTGYVHQAVLDDFDSLDGVDVYACGAPGMISAARNDFRSLRSLPEGRFYCDAFVTSN